MNRKFEISNTGVEVRINEAKQGVEIHFPVKPSAQVLAEVKACGFKWGKFNKCWYAKLSELNVTRANKIAGTSITINGSENYDPAGAMVDANEDAGYAEWAARNL